jgi:hypothetical protein
VIDGKSKRRGVRGVIIVERLDRAPRRRHHLSRGRGTRPPGPDNSHQDHIMSARFRIALPAVLVLGLAVAAPAGAQDVSLVPSPVTAAAIEPTTAPAAGPTMESASVAVRHQADAAPAAAQRRGGSAPGTALMIVGGAAVLVGLVIGGGAGGAIAVGGAVLGLYGLYQYLQ